MKTASPEFIAILATGQFALADCYQFDLVGGGVLRYTSFDTSIVLNGETFSAGGQTGPFVDRDDNRAKISQRLGLQVDELTFDIIPGAAQVGGMPFLHACRLGLFDGADFTLYRAALAGDGVGTGIFPPIVAAAGAVIWFAGLVGPVDAGRSMATFRIASHTELLNQNLPRNLYQAGCVNTLGDEACGVNLGALGVTTTVLSGSTAQVINVTSAQPSGYYSQGKIVFNDGPAAGFWRMIKEHTAGAPAQLSLMPILPAVPVDGNSITIYPGCNKSWDDANGCPKFANQARFRGTPFVPVAETAV